MIIGIGISTFKRPEMLAKLLDSIHKYTTYDYILHVAEDTDEDRRGVAFRKNQSLRALQHADHIFLLDDDVEIIKKGWEEFFINSGYNHLLYLNASHNLITTAGELELYADCGGVFMYMRKGAVERVGAFDEGYKMYGYEHADYSCRILGGHGQYPMLKDTSKYIYSEDYSNPNHVSSITNSEKNLHFFNNTNKWINRNNETYIPL